MEGMRDLIGLKKGTCDHAGLHHGATGYPTPEPTP